MLVHVAVPVPGLGLLTYRVPDNLPQPVVGGRVVVPLGTRIVTGIVMDDASASTVADAAVKDVKEVLDADAFVPVDIVELARWTAEYYAAGPGDTITAVLPPMARGGRSDAHKTVRVAAITVAGMDVVGTDSALRRPCPESLRNSRTRHLNCSLALQPGCRLQISRRAASPQMRSRGSRRKA